MESWVNKVAVITDCGDEVGISVMEKLSKAGMITIGFAQNNDVLYKAREKLKPLITNKINGNIVLYDCDIRSEKQLEDTFAIIKDTYEGVDVLINNACFYIDCLLSNGDLGNIKKIIDVNINAAVACTRFAANSMIERKIRGHIIFINDFFNLQTAKISIDTLFLTAKAAVASVNGILRLEFRYLKVNVKVTNITCGKVENFDESGKSMLKGNDIAQFVESILATPEHLQMHEILLESVVEEFY